MRLSIPRQGFYATQGSSGGYKDLSIICQKLTSWWKKAVHFYISFWIDVDALLYPSIGYNIWPFMSQYKLQGI